MKNVREYDANYIAHTYKRNDLLITHGEGELLYDECDNEYIDMGSGIGVNIFGANDEIIRNAVERQMSLVTHTSNLYYTKPQTTLAKALCEKTGLSRVFFCNSGAEANECAIKTARKYSHDKYGDGRNRIITLVNSFHGRTITTLSATGQEAFHTDFAPFTEGFDYCDADDTDALVKLAESGKHCAIMLEIIRGEGGVLPLSEKFVRCAAELAEKHDILLIIDEVQTGNGRTGKYFSYMYFGISPDLVTTAKGLGGGLPIGACLFGEKTKDTLTFGTHGSTFGGNPVCASAALTVVERVDDELMNEVVQKGEYIRAALGSSENVESITGMGLMLGIKCNKNAASVAAECMKRGVLVLTAKDKVRLLPPLNISEKSLEKAIGIIKEVIAE